MLRICRRQSASADADNAAEGGSYVAGLPYYLSGDIENRGDLFVQTPEGFKKTYNVQVGD